MRRQPQRGCCSAWLTKMSWGHVQRMATGGRSKRVEDGRKKGGKRAEPYLAASASCVELAWAWMCVSRMAHVHVPPAGFGGSHHFTCLF